MTDHAVFQDDLKAYADGELSWPRRFAVRRHLTHCASCREELNEMTQITEDLQASDPADALDPALRAKILGIAEPTLTQAPPLPVKEGEEQDSQAYRTPPLRPPVLGGALRSKEVASWKRLLPIMWAAGAVTLVCLVLFPAFQGVHESARRIVAMSPAMPHSVEATPVPPVALGSMPSGAAASYPGQRDFGQASVPAAKPEALALADTNSLLRQVHKEASIGVQVANPEAASDKAEMLVKEAGGFVANNTLNTGDIGLKSAQMTVKVPVMQFETVLGQIAKLGSVQSKNVTGEDITDKASDADQTENVLEGDVTNSEARLKALGTKAKWSDQQATRDLRTQLAQARARLVLLRRMAALSTITVDLSQTPKPSAPTPVTGGFLNGLKGNTHDALQSLLSSAGMLLALAIWLLAYAPIWIPLLLVGRYALREYRKRQVV